MGSSCTQLVQRVPDCTELQAHTAAVDVRNHYCACDQGLSVASDTVNCCPAAALTLSVHVPLIALPTLASNSQRSA